MSVIDTQQPGTGTIIAPPQAGVATARATRRGRAFVLHVAEMLAVMFAGMLVLGGALRGVVALTGGDLSGASATVSALVMAATMTLPMVWWMRRRGHPARQNAEMAASMIVPTILAIALGLAGALGEHGVLMVQHVVMIPAMIGVMLARFDHYAH